jgi:hypothetical protein
MASINITLVTKKSAFFFAYSFAEMPICDLTAGRNYMLPVSIHEPRPGSELMQ